MSGRSLNRADAEFHGGANGRSGGNWEISYGGLTQSIILWVLNRTPSRVITGRPLSPVNSVPVFKAAIASGEQVEPSAAAFAAAATGRGFLLGLAPSALELGFGMITILGAYD
jgi:hypothetical protein